MSLAYSPLLILQHLQEWLPKFTNLFTEEVSVTAEIVAGTPQILRITYPNHGYSVGQKIKVEGSKLDNGIVAVAEYTDVFRFTTNKPHDLTEGYTEGIELQGFTDTGFNGSHELFAVPSKTTFEIEKGALTLPVQNGNEVLREIWENGINTTLTITGVPDNDTIEIELVGKPEFDELPVYAPNIIGNYRIGIAVDAERAAAVYTKQETGKAWLFIVMEDVAVSRDINIANDASQNQSAASYMRIKNIGSFSLVVFLPTVNDYTAASAVQLCYNELYLIFLRCITGVVFDSLCNSSYTATYTGHGPSQYTRAYYVHAFSFEQVFDTTYAETFIEGGKITRAYREIDISFSDIQDGSNIILTEEE